MRYPSVAVADVPRVAGIERDVQSVLLYFDLWHYPLTADEIFAFLPRSVCSRATLENWLATEREGTDIAAQSGYYFLKHRTADVVTRRREGERRARRMWLMARAASSVIKRFPFVRGIMVSGELSKNLATGDCDVDFFIVTAPNRLWVARTLLIVFKKVFLFNRKKFFCLNTFATEESLALSERNIYVAAEVAYLKPVYGRSVHREFMEANAWIKEFFPNFDPLLLPCSDSGPGENRSTLQLSLEFLIDLLPCDRIDTSLLRWMERVWKRRYPELDEVTRGRSFRSTKTESRTYPGDYQERVLSWYAQRMNALVRATAE